MAVLNNGLHGLHSFVTRSSSTSSSNSASSLLTTLVVSALIAFVWLLAFIIVRRSNRRFYQPRSFLSKLRPFQRTPESPNGWFNWIPAMYKLPDIYVLQHQSLDAYLFLRYLKIITVICLVGCFITIPILFPLNIVNGNGNQQLDMLTISNVRDFSRYFGHCFVAWIFVGFVFFMITRESIYYINLRQAYSFHPSYANRISSRTVLFTSVPTEYLNEAKIRRMFGANRVQNVWISTDVSELADKVKERNSAAMKLEGAEIKLIRSANEARLKSLKKGGSVAEESAAQGTEVDDESGSAAARWLKKSDRPTHRTKFLIGKKVDTIDWCRSEIERLTPEIEHLQARHRTGDAKLVSAVFVEFYKQADAQDAFQARKLYLLIYLALFRAGILVVLCLSVRSQREANGQAVAHNLPLHMSPRYVGLDPTSIIWSNLRIIWWERIVRNFATIAFVCVLIIFWAIPVAFVGAISNLNYLENKLPWLKFINNLPSVLLGLITGLLPVVLLAVLMALLPIILRLMAKLGGLPTTAAVELRTQNFYFAFQFVQVFLVATIASAVSAVVTQIIQNPTSVASLLAKNIPKASNLYLSYIILQGLTIASQGLLNVVGLILSKVLGRILDNSPRKMYNRWISLSGLSWGTVIPPMSLLAVIAIIYSCIAPLVLVFATIGLYFFYFSFRYNLLYVLDSPIDTQGLIYPRALQHLTVGCYLLIVCLIGLFAIGSASQGIAVGPLILMIIFLVFIILYHVSLNAALDPLLKYLPRNLEAEEEALLEESRSRGGQNGESKAGALAAEGASAPNTTNGASRNGAYNGAEADGVDSAEKGIPATTALPAPHQKPNFLTKFLRPDKYTDYATMRRLIPADIDVPHYEPEVERDAYFHPAVTDQLPLLWVPRDEAGISRQEVAHSAKVVPISDQDAWLDEKNKIQWNRDGLPPIYNEPVYY